MLAPTSEPTVASVFAPKTAIEPDGTVIGYASLFGAVDQARDMVLRGAFADTLRLREPARFNEPSAASDRRPAAMSAAGRG